MKPIEERKRDEMGRLLPEPRNFTPLLRCEAVKMFADTYPTDRARNSALHTLKWFLDFNSVGPEELLSMSDDEIKMCIKKACLAKAAEGKGEMSRFLYYVVQRFLTVNNRIIQFTRTEKKQLFKKKPKRIAKQYIPTREDIYRMVDSMPRINYRQWLRNRALILCLWQSGVRNNCLVSWTWGIFKNQLYPEPKIPVEIKVVASRPEGVYDVAQDIKLSKYNVQYYYTFLHKEAAHALKAYLDARMEDGWKPKDSDPIWVTEAQNCKGNPMSIEDVRRIVKTAAKQIGIPSDRIWPHCLRKAFRKTLYESGVDPDVAEALMGHKLPGSRGNYFDYHDKDFVKKEYMKGFWDRIGINRIRKLEKEFVEIEKHSKELEKENKELKEKIVELERRFLELVTTLHNLGKQAPKQIEQQNSQTQQQTPKQKVITEKEIEKYLAKGWRYVATINKNKIIIEKP